MAPKSFKIITLGCKVNQYETAFLRESLLKEDWIEAPKDGEADVTIVNTCIVTQKAAYQSRQAIRRAVRENPHGRIAAAGCYAQCLPEELARIRGLHLIAGNTAKGRLKDILSGERKGDGIEMATEDFRPDAGFEYQPIRRFLDRTRAFLKIQDGCESFCSYCVVPYARGPRRSLDAPRVIGLLKTLCDEGYREAVLTGIHLGQYGADLNQDMNLNRLLRLIKSESLPLRIRLSSLDPNEIDGELIGMIASEEWLCRHVHIPLQSGDDGILKMMNRRYTSREFERLIKEIHDRVPYAAIGLDVMVGFPGEDEPAFQNTCALIRDLPISYLHVFPFSPRKGTAAASLPGRIDQGIIRQRASRLRSLGQHKRRDFYHSCLGRSFWVLTEGWASEDQKEIKALSDNYLPVTFSSPRLLKNTLVSVQLDGLKERGLHGRVEEKECGGDRCRMKTQ